MTTTLAAMTNNVNVGINEVVSIFVAKHEDALFAKKDTLSAKIRDLKSKLTALDKSIIASIVKSEYEASIVNLGLKLEVDSVVVGWGEGYGRKADQIIIAVNFCDEHEKAFASRAFFKPIAETDKAERALLNTNLESANADLLEVMGQIKTIGRKERQIRGRIAEMKLEEAGKTDLLSNPELLSLVMA